ncbi:MAG: hypothetical protein KKE37_05295 [Verrucomicrobia bacterium]|nr:hypothetical protein [Verrucomicrobiota bacterium]MBU4292179.1 hypothetical protein [Verrucomicrobiota bacterium]MBU4428753.1 hypothetical protein [Verrucomicrobiota bacterium]MCG2681623.1 hypothetical protein [Kiritimatiellia bacterium]
MRKFVMAFLIGAVLLLAVFLVITGRSFIGDRDMGQTTVAKVTLALPPVKPGAVSGLVGLGNRSLVPPQMPAPQKAPDTNVPPLLKRLLRDAEAGKLTREQIEPYLRENKRSANSLLVAARITGDIALLREAAAKFPNDPRVLLDWFLRGDATPGERRQALDAFRRVEPQNALGDYLSALDHFKNGNVDEAMRDMWQSRDKDPMDEYFRETVQDAEEAYRVAGYSRAEAAVAAAYGAELPQLSKFRELSLRLLDLQDQYAQAGDTDMAQSVIEMGLLLGSQMQGAANSALLSMIGGMSIERQVLQRLDPDAVLTASGQTVGERLTELEQHTQIIRKLGDDPDLQLSKLDANEVASLFERAKLFGELEAFRWLQNKHGSGTTTP